MGLFSLCCGGAATTKDDEQAPLWTPLPGERRKGGGGAAAPGLAFGQGALRYDPFASAYDTHRKKPGESLWGARQLLHCCSWRASMQLPPASVPLPQNFLYESAACVHSFELPSVASQPGRHSVVPLPPPLLPLQAATSPTRLLRMRRWLRPQTTHLPPASQQRAAGQQSQAT